MSRFRFRLEGVLRVRRAQESDARTALAAANAHLRQRLEAREEAHLHYRQMVGRQRPACTVAALASDRLDAALAADRLDAAARAVTRAAGDAAVAQVSWTQAARRVSVLERLEERRRAEHADVESRAEVRAVDDLVTSRWVSERAERAAAP